MWKPSLTPVRILFGDRLWVGLPASKLQFNAQETTGYAFFFLFFFKAALQDCVFRCGGAIYRALLDHTVLSFLGEGKHWHNWASSNILMGLT